MPGASVLIIAPDYSLAMISWDLQHQLIKKFDLETIRDNAKDRILEMSNGSFIKVASVSKADSAVGRSYDLIIFDEAALNDTGGGAFNTALLPTLDKPNSKCIFISTPRGDNWFREFFNRGFDVNYGEWLSIHADYRENPRASDKVVSDAKRDMSNAEFEQEYLANFVTFEGQVWGFDSDKCIQDLTNKIIEITRAPSLHEIIGGIDFGYRDPTAMAVLVVEQDEEGRNIYYLIDEYFNAARTTETHAEEIGHRVEIYDLDWVFADSAAAQMRYDLAAMYDITTIGAVKSITDGIGAVGAVIDNDRLIIHEECVEAIYAVRNYKWKGDRQDGDWKIETEKPEHNRASHMADAIRYAIYTYERSMGGIT